MPRIFAIDWDRHEVRGLVVQSGPTGTSITGAWAAPLPGAAEGSAPTASQIGAALATAMGQRTVGNATAIVGVGRDHVQMKLLSLPPAPADELPDLVRFQAEREFTALGSDAALDFIPLAGDAQTPYQVLAVSLSSAGVAEAREVCQLLDTEPNRMELRGCAAAALVERAGAVPTENYTLVVSPLTDEADLVVLAGGVVRLLRTVRLPDAPQVEGRQRTLLAEIRRTIAAARQQSGEQQVDRVIICGDAGSGVAREIAADLGISVEMFDPAENAPSGFTNQGIPAGSMPRFAAVLGMALNEADHRAPIVDFINVRRRTVKSRFDRRHAIAAAAAAVLLVGLSFTMWWQSTSSARELARIREEIQQLEPQVKQANELAAKAAAVERWLATDVPWLDGLDRLSERLRPKPLSEKDFPVNEDLVVTQLTIARPPASDAAAGRVDLRAIAKNSAALTALENRIRDTQHQVSTGQGRADTTTVPGYEWAFNLRVGVMPSSEKGAP